MSIYGRVKILIYKTGHLMVQILDMYIYGYVKILIYKTDTLIGSNSVHMGV